MKKMTWDVLRDIGEIKILSSCYFFFIVVPIIAKLFSLFPDSITIPFSSYEIPIPLELPFSWILFFWAAFFVSIGLTIYKIFCPRLISTFPNYEEFAYSKRSGLFFRSVFYDLVDTKNKSKMREVINKINSEFQSDFDPDKTNSILKGGTVVDPDFFYAVRDLCNVSRPISRTFCFVAYAIGLLLILIVMLQNVVFVLNSV